MDELFPKRKKNKLIGLQLAPLIDIFVLIIIFLIKGTVMSSSSMTPPPDLNPAKSKSPEGLEPAGQIYVSQNQISFSMINEKIEVSEFLNQIENNSLDQLNGTSGEIAKKLKNYLSEFSSQEKNSGLLLNFMADAAVDYKTIFEISKFCRQIGFQNMLYVAQGEK